jgi:hypothetical protein
MSEPPFERIDAHWKDIAATLAEDLDADTILLMKNIFIVGAMSGITTSRAFLVAGNADDLALNLLKPLIVEAISRVVTQT